MICLAPRLGPTRQQRAAMISDEVKMIQRDHPAPTFSEADPNTLRPPGEGQTVDPEALGQGVAPGRMGANDTPTQEGPTAQGVGRAVDSSEASVADTSRLARGARTPHDSVTEPTEGEAGVLDVASGSSQLNQSSSDEGDSIDSAPPHTTTPSEQSTPSQANLGLSSWQAVVRQLTETHPKFDPSTSQNPYVRGELLFQKPEQTGNFLCAKCGTLGHLSKDCSETTLSEMDQHFLSELMRIHELQLVRAQRREERAAKEVLRPERPAQKDPATKQPLSTSAQFRRDLASGKYSTSTIAGGRFKSVIADHVNQATRRGGRTHRTSKYRTTKPTVQKVVAGKYDPEGYLTDQKLGENAVNEVAKAVTMNGTYMLNDTRKLLRKLETLLPSTGQAPMKEAR